MHLLLELQADAFHKQQDEAGLFDVLAKIQNLKKIEKYLSEKLGSRAFI
jgi:hypothetical protein